MSVRLAARVSLMAAVTAALAWVRIPLPFTPVPVTGQTLGVMLSGALLGPSGGALAQTIYLGLGAVGLPVFAGGSGPSALTGPAAGFLWGFVPGAWTCGYLSRRWPGDAGLAAALVAGGMMVPYVLGALYLAGITGLGLAGALALGVVPFLPGDLLKVLAALPVVRRMTRSGAARGAGQP